MPTLKVQKVDLKKSFDWGSVYTIIGEIDGELETVELSSKTAPRVGETIDGTIEDSQWGKKFKKAPSGGFGGKAGFTPRAADPEVQKMIVRQNALSNAVSFLSALAALEKKPDQLTTDNVLLIATKFAKFSLGEVEVKKAEPTPEEFPIDDGPYSDEAQE